jgi:hypothetical protein
MISIVGKKWGYYLPVSSIWVEIGANGFGSVMDCPYASTI